MPRLAPIDPASATGETAQLLGDVKKKLGGVPNLLRTLANSPVGLKAYLGLSGALAESSLSADLRERIALVVAETNGCEYCLAAHSAIGKSVGLDDAALEESRRGESSDESVAAVLDFARAVVQERGFVSDASIERLREAGFDDGAVTEIVVTVVLNVLTNWFNHVADTEVDFPAAPELAAR